MKDRIGFRFPWTKNKFVKGPECPHNCQHGCQNAQNLNTCADTLRRMRGTHNFPGLIMNVATDLNNNQKEFQNCGLQECKDARRAVQKQII